MSQPSVINVKVNVSPEQCYYISGVYERR